MIKLGKFTFEEYDTESHWIDFARFGNLTGQEVEHFRTAEEFNFALKEDTSYQVSFDQSTSNTGIFIKSSDNTEAYMLEYSKPRGWDADEYIFSLEQVIHQVCEKAIITHLIYERPIKTENFQSSRVLFQLEGMLRALPRRYSEFKASRLDCIENSSWRRVVILPEFNGYDRKHASEESVKAIFHWTSNYCGSIGSDKDIYEAIGVMFGWFFNSYDELGRPYVRGDRFHGNIGCFLLPGISAVDVATQLKEDGLESVWAMQNPRKSIYENIACAVEKYKVVCVEFTDLHTMLALTIEANMKWLEPDKLTVVMVAANYVDNRLFKITGDSYHFVI